MACIQLAPQYILLGLAEALVTPSCSVISFHLTPSHIRGISLHFLTLSYGGGCFLGALIIQLLYLLSGGNWYPNTLHEGNLEHFFFFLAMLMTINTLVFCWISYRYLDLSVVQSRGVGSSLLAEKLLQYKTCLRFYDTMERSSTTASVETVL
uniref:Solute carrier family 15 member 5 n=1 Tax=Hucho hucho TaxID=62062 RepID=A0A4W5RCQ7_9TELE